MIESVVICSALMFMLIYRHRSWKALPWPAEALRPPQYQAHRGYWQLGALENSMEAFVAAKQQGFEMFELDVRLSKDRIPVVFHDSDLKRLGGQNLQVSEVTAQELKEWTNAPSLEEVLISPDVPKFINIEIKSDEVFDGALEIQVAGLIKMHRCEKRILFSSFNPLSIRRLRQLLPQVPRALLATQEKDPSNKIYLRQLWLAPYIGVHALHLDWNYVSPEDIEYWKRRQVPVALWTVNDPLKAQRYLRAGALSIISDRLKADS